jgi:hypothetical protein
MSGTVNGYMSMSSTKPFYHHQKKYALMFYIKEGSKNRLVAESLSHESKQRRDISQELVLDTKLIVAFDQLNCETKTRTKELTSQLLAVK